VITPQYLGTEQSANTTRVDPPKDCLRVLQWRRLLAQFLLDVPVAAIEPLGNGQM